MTSRSGLPTMGKLPLPIEKNISLANHCSFRVGGPARYFIEVKDLDEIRRATATAKERHWPFFLLGGGTNLIVADDGFPGLVIKLKTEAWSMENFTLTAEAGVLMSLLIDESIRAALAGLEWAGGLPGTFGGAIRGNAGAFGGEIKDTIESVTSFDPAVSQIVTRTNTECQFAYRDSIFKHNREVIIQAKLRLNRGETEKLRRVADNHIRYRQDHHPLNYPNAGSVFKNIPTEQIPKNVLGKFQDVLKTDPSSVIPTAAVIDRAGLKGMKIGGAQVSEKHPNYIINTGSAKTADIISLIAHVRQKVREEFGLELELEQQIVR